MANPKHVAILKQGVEAWNAWRRQFPLESVDLSGALLSGVFLGAVDFHGVDLSSADLSGANLAVADLSGARMRGALLSRAMLVNGVNIRRAQMIEADLRMAFLGEADLSGAILNQADLSKADLSKANLNRAYLRETNLSGAMLREASFCGALFDRVTIIDALMGGTAFSAVDLRTVAGMESVHHLGPSSIGVDTILRSGGHIPDIFLRGCGINPLIQRLLAGDRASMTDAFYVWVNEGRASWHLQSCFISYSSDDKPFVHRLQEALNASGVNYWYAPEHGRWGEDLTRQIDREISMRDRVILVCSEHSLESDWVLWEIDKTREQEKARGTTILYPIMVDDAVLSWSDPRASRIREILVGDFRGATKGKAFEERFRRVMEGLRDEG